MDEADSKDRDLKMTFNVLEPLPYSKLEIFEDIVMHDSTSFAVKGMLRRNLPGHFKKSLQRQWSST